MTVLALNHVGITVSDMDEAVGFWEGGLGLRLDGRGRVAYEHLSDIIGLGPSDLEWAELSLPGGMIELFRYHEPRGATLDQRTCDAGNVHICLEVNDVDAVTEVLRQRGATTMSEGAREIPFGDWEGWKSIYVRAHDGVTVELVQRPTLRDHTQTSTGDDR